MKKILVLLAFIFSTLTVFAGDIKISNEGKEFIKQQESCVLHAYWDSNGYSIGYGHHGKEVYKGMVITQAKANELFANDVTKVENSVENLIKSLPYTYNFSQGFIDGFISFTYNVGSGGAQSSIFYQRLKKCRVVNGVMNKEDLHFAIAGIKISKVRCNAHKRRRIGEYNLMMS